MDSGRFELLRQADFVLSHCGRFLPPVGSVVYIEKKFLIQAVLPTGSNQTFYKEVTGDTTWCWRSISTALSGNPPAVAAQVLKPDGHFAFNDLLDLTLIAGYGSNRYLLSKEIECPPGSKIQLTLDDNYLAAAAVQPVSFLCEGAYAYYLKDGLRSPFSLCPEQAASDMPRVFATPNQNLMAPCWLHGEGPSTPDGFEDDAFTYGDGNSNVATLPVTGQKAAQASIQISDAHDFEVRRFLFDVTGDSQTAGSWLCRIRLGSGYAFTDDYLDVARYLGSAYIAKGLVVPHGDQLRFDLVLVDTVGSGSMSIACYADGVKRRKV